VKGGQAIEALAEHPHQDRVSVSVGLQAIAALKEKGFDG
jgi:hypothetical protein